MMVKDNYLVIRAVNQRANLREAVTSPWWQVLKARGCHGIHCLLGWKLDKMTSKVPYKLQFYDKLRLRGLAWKHKGCRLFVNFSYTDISCSAQFCL